MKNDTKGINVWYVAGLIRSRFCVDWGYGVEDLLVFTFFDE